MESLIQRPTQEDIYREAYLLSRLGNILLVSIKNNDRANMEQCAREIYKIKAIITARKCKTAVYHILQPFRIMVWFGAGGLIGTTLMLMSHAEPRMNILLLLASIILLTISEFIVFNGIKIGNAITAIILNKSQKPASRQIALIIEQYRARITIQQ